MAGEGGDTRIGISIPIYMPVSCETWFLSIISCGDFLSLLLSHSLNISLFNNLTSLHFHSSIVDSVKVFLVVPVQGPVQGLTLSLSLGENAKIIVRKTVMLLMLNKRKGENNCSVRFY
jgi:hypothetical protein